VADGFEHACDPLAPECGDTAETVRCWQLVWSRGTAPWDASRALALPVTIDPTFGVGITSLSCDACDGAACAGQDSVCDEGPDVVTAKLPGTLVLRLDPSGGYEHGFWVEAEIDLGASMARVCRFRITDVVCEPDYAEPPCATSGTLTLNRAPATDADLAGLGGILDATFADGLRVRGIFAVE
jgi:hypothetical protein